MPFYFMNLWLITDRHRYWTYKYYWLQGQSTLSPTQGYGYGVFASLHRPKHRSFLAVAAAAAAAAATTTTAAAALVRDLKYPEPSTLNLKRQCCETSSRQQRQPLLRLCRTPASCPRPVSPRVTHLAYRETHASPVHLVRHGGGAGLSK